MYANSQYILSWHDARIGRRHASPNNSYRLRGGSSVVRFALMGNEPGRDELHPATATDPQDRGRFHPRICTESLAPFERRYGKGAWQPPPGDRAADGETNSDDQSPAGQDSGSCAGLRGLGDRAGVLGGTARFFRSSSVGRPKSAKRDDGRQNRRCPLGLFGATGGIR
jgi:hypothetical protein